MNGIRRTLTTVTLFTGGLLSLKGQTFHLVGAANSYWTSDAPFTWGGSFGVFVADNSHHMIYGAHYVIANGTKTYTRAGFQLRDESRRLGLYVAKGIATGECGTLNLGLFGDYIILNRQISGLDLTWAGTSRSTGIVLGSTARWTYDLGEVTALVAQIDPGYLFVATNETVYMGLEEKKPHNGGVLSLSIGLSIRVGPSPASLHMNNDRERGW